MSDKIATTHEISTKRPMKLTSFNYACWILGFLSLIGLIIIAHLILEGIVIGSFIGLMGAPVRDGGSPPQWAMLQLSRAQDRRKNGGKRTVMPLSRHGKKYKSPWDEIQIVPASLRLGASVVNAPLFTKTGRAYLTIFLRVKSGAAGVWVANDAEGKFGWDLRFIAALNSALAVTNEQSIWIALGLNSRPSDRTFGYEYNAARIEEKALAAAESPTGEGFTKKDKLLGDNAMEHFNSAHDQGGDTLNYIALRMPWPRTGLKRRVKLDDPDAFAATKLNKTIQALLIELGNCDLDIEPDSYAEAAQLMDNVKNLRQIATRDTYRQRDRELVEEGLYEYLDDAPSSGEDAWRPDSVTSDPADPGYLLIDGTYCTGGYATALKHSTVDPGFQIQSLVFSDDIYFTTATLIHAKLINREKTKAREAERFHEITSSLTTFNSHLSDPDADARKSDLQKWRRELANAGARMGEFYIPFVVLGTSPDDLRAKWDQVTVATARNYTLKRAMTPGEIADLMLATLAIID